MDASVHPIIVAAAEGDLPDWAVAGDKRRAHMARVSELLGQWADALELNPDDRLRWRAVLVSILSASWTNSAGWSGLYTASRDSDTRLHGCSHQSSASATASGILAGIDVSAWADACAASSISQMAITGKSLANRV